MAKNLGIGKTYLLHRWKVKMIARSGPSAAAMDDQLAQLRDELQCMQRERDILKGCGYLQPARVADVYPVVDLLKEEGFEVNHLRDVRGVSRAAYYQPLITNGAAQ